MASRPLHLLRRAPLAPPAGWCTVQPRKTTRVKGLSSRSGSPLWGAAEEAVELAVTARREVLAALGARGGVADELLVFNAPSLGAGARTPGLSFPLEDEAHLAVWRQYAAATGHGVLVTLSGSFPQLGFPVREGISQWPEYRAATRRGEFSGGQVALELIAPHEVTLQLHPCLGGTVPVLSAARREDFVALVRALAARNEPVAVPDSMGACLVAGITNWDRVRRYRETWLASHPEAGEGGWRQEFAVLAARKELYQDRLIVLAAGPYSGLEASAVGCSPLEWDARSLLIRLAHECTHYLTLRVFGRLQHNVLEELVADFAGLVEGLGEYRADLARAFLGIEALPQLRPGGRLANYRGFPPLSDEAFAIEARLVDAAIDVLAAIAAQGGEALSSPQALGSLICSLVPLSLEELLLPEVQEELLSAAGGRGR